MPLYPVASQNLRTHAPRRGTAPVRLDQAVTCPWIALNSQRRIRALRIDVDHADGPELVAELPFGCPKPTLVIDPWSGRSHAILPLATPVLTGPRARPRPIGLANHAQGLLAAALRGTPLPFTNLVKCPTGLVQNLTGQRMLRESVPATPLVWEAYVESNGGLMWLTQVGDGPAELNDVVNALRVDYADELLQSARQNWRKKRGEPSAFGRNCWLFDVLRHWTYDRGEQDLDKIAAEAGRLNATLPVPLSDAEINTIARSVAKFMRNKYRPKREHGTRGRDREVNRYLDTRGRKELAGRRTAAQRKARTHEQIASVVVEMRAANEKITQTSVAQRLNLSERTVRNYWISVAHLVEAKQPEAEDDGSADSMPDNPGVVLPLAA